MLRSKQVLSLAKSSQKNLVSCTKAYATAAKVSSAKGEPAQKVATFSLSPKTQILAKVFTHNKQVKNGEVPKTIYSYNLLMTTYSQNLLVQDVEQLFALMKRDNITPNEFTYWCMLHCYVKTGDFAKAEALFEKILTGQTEIKASYNMFHTFFKIYVENKEYEKAENLVLNRTKGLLSETERYSFYLEVVKLYNSRKMPELSEKLVREKMLKEGIKGDITIFNLLVDGYSAVKDWKKAESVITLLHELQMPYEISTFNRLMLPHALNSDYHRCQKYINWARRWGVKMDSDAYALVLCSYYRVPQTEWYMDKEVKHLAADKVEISENSIIVLREVLEAWGAPYEMFGKMFPNLNFYQNKYWL